MLKFESRLCIVRRLAELLLLNGPALDLSGESMAYETLSAPWALLTRL